MAIRKPKVTIASSRVVQVDGQSFICKNMLNAHYANYIVKRAINRAVAFGEQRAAAKKRRKTS